MLNLLGKDFSGIPREEHHLNNELLYDLNMGYEHREKVHPLQAVRYHAMESGYLHPWSFDNVAEQYGFSKLEEFMPFRDYLELPAHCVDRLIQGLTKGRKKRKEADDKARAEQAERNKQTNAANIHRDGQQMDPLTAEIVRQMNLGGKDTS